MALICYIIKTMLYKHVLKPILFRFDPEAVHDFFTSAGKWAGKYSLTRNLISMVYQYRGRDISKTIDGITYRTPFLLSAGFDYNGQLTQILSSIGLGGEEVGSVTARPCEGNPSPRLTRLPKSQSILVNKGLKNDGVDVIIKRLKTVQGGLTLNRQSQSRSDLTEPPFVVGISIARTNDEKSVPIQAGIDDYVYSFKRLNEENVGDYYTINISCPNAFGGEAFTTPELLTRLLSAIKAILCSKPVYVKMPINIPWEQFHSLLKVIDVQGLNGVIIGNLNKDYNSLDVRNEAPNMYKGGLSGKPCSHPSTDLIYKTRELYGKRFTIIGVGGVMSPETMQEKFDAGADLVQVITGLIFEGPGLIKRLGKKYGERK
jgi:dihydroorotate dehydrogenase